MEYIIQIICDDVSKISSINKICSGINDNITKIVKSSKMYLNETVDKEKYLTCAVMIKLNTESIDDLIRNLNEKNKDIEIKFKVFNNSYLNNNPVDLFPIRDIDDSILIEKKPISQILSESNYEKSNKINRIIPCHSSYLLLDRPLKMLIVNCTPDSFSDNNFNLYSPEEYKLIEERILDIESKFGIDIIDIGGESTRPFSKEVSSEEEIKRVLPMIELIRKNEFLKRKIISLDTRKSLVIRELYDRVDVINDVSGLRFDEELVKVVSQLNKPYIYCHSRGDPSNMLNEENTKYNNIIYDIVNETRLGISKLTSSGMFEWNIINDPGIGFAKKGDDNFEILKNLERIKKELDYPMLIAASKKRFLEESRYDEFTNNLITFYSFSKGADIIRLHEINEGTNKIVELMKKLK